MTRSPTAAPRLACRLLGALLPATVAGRSTLGDVIEEYHRRPRGVTRRLWFWWITFDLACRYVPARAASALGGLGRDLVYATRLARRYPGLVSAAVLSLSLAIGVSTAGFSIANNAWLRPTLAADRSVVRVFRTHANGASLTLPMSELQQLRERVSRVSLEAALLTSERIAVTAGAAPEQATVAFVTGRYFDILNAAPGGGRLLRPDDDRPGAPAVVVLDYQYWRRHFSGDWGMLGRTLSIRGSEFLVVGIAGRDLIDPSRREPAMWAAMTTRDRLPKPETGSATPPPAWAIGRLAPGVGMKDANTELAGLVTSIVPASTVPRATAFEVSPVVDEIELANNRRMLLAVFAAIALVLLLASANVSNLQLAGAAARRQELAVRLSFGASRERLLRQILTESLLLSAASSGLGLLLARWLAPLLAAGMNMPGADVEADPRAYAFVAGATALTAIATALAPAYYGVRDDVATSLAGRARRVGSALMGRTRSIFVGVQAAASIVLVALAALQVRALVHLAWMEPGIDVSQLLAVGTAHPRTSDDEARLAAFWPGAIERLRAIPGVEQVALAEFAPFNVSRADPNGMAADATDADYFATVGLRVVRGRTYTATEVAGRVKVAVISEQFARRLWRDEDPLGSSAARIDSMYDKYQIIGVVADAWLDRVHVERVPMIYVPVTPADGATQLAVRTRTPAALAGPIRAALRDVSPDVPITTTVPGDVYRQQFERPRRYAALGASVALFALVLSVVGLFGVTAFSVRARTREIGIRMALGGRRGDVTRLLIRDGLRPVLVGLGVGLIAALLAGHAVAGLLFGMSEHDPIALAAAVGILLGAALTAVVLPTRKAGGLDPAIVLRES